MENVKEYKKKAVVTTSMIPFAEGMDMAGVSISEADARDGSPKIGDMIAFSKEDNTDRWLVSEKYLAANYELA